MNRILAVDPGCSQSALVVYEPDKRLVQLAVIEPNDVVLSHIAEYAKAPDLDLVVEMVACYGMPVGAEVFETCVWIGRFCQAWGKPAKRIFRRDIKLALCGNSRANDGNIRQSLIDRFGPGRDKAIGLKKTPGPLYALRADMWAALAVAVVATSGEG